MYKARYAGIAFVSPYKDLYWTTKAEPFSRPHNNCVVFDYDNTIADYETKQILPAFWLAVSAKAEGKYIVLMSARGDRRYTGCWSVNKAKCIAEELAEELHMLGIADFFDEVRIACKPYAIEPAKGGGYYDDAAVVATKQDRKIFCVYAAYGLIATSLGIQLCIAGFGYAALQMYIGSYASSFYAWHSYKTSSHNTKWAYISKACLLVCYNKREARYTEQMLIAECIKAGLKLGYGLANLIAHNGLMLGVPPGDCASYSTKQRHKQRLLDNKLFPAEHTSQAKQAFASARLGKVRQPYAKPFAQAKQEAELARQAALPLLACNSSGKQQVLISSITEYSSFIKEHNLIEANVRKCIAGLRAQHKGWSFSKLN